MSAPSGPSSKYHPATIIFHLGQDAATSVGIEGIAVFAWLMGLLYMKNSVLQNTVCFIEILLIIYCMTEPPKQETVAEYPKYSENFNLWNLTEVYIRAYESSLYQTDAGTSVMNWSHHRTWSSEYFSHGLWEVTDVLAAAFRRKAVTVTLGILRLRAARKFITISWKDNWKMKHNQKHGTPKQEQSLEKTQAL